MGEKSEKFSKEGMMEEIRAGRLIDEALHEPVKNAFRLGVEFMDRNRVLAAMTMGVFFVLSLLDAVPVIGMFTAVALGVFSQAVQIYVGRAFYGAEHIEAFVSEAEGTKLKTFLTRYAGPGFGAWFGWFVFTMAFVMLFIVLLAAGGADMAMLDEAALQEDPEAALALLTAMMTAGLPLVIVALALAYVYPIAQGRVIMSETFGEAFKAVFSILTPSVWRAAMNKAYFGFVFYFSLALMGISFLIGVVMTLLILIPILGVILAVVWMMFLVYVFMMILGIANVMAREIAEGGNA